MDQDEQVKMKAAEPAASETVDETDDKLTTLPQKSAMINRKLYKNVIMILVASVFLIAFFTLLSILVKHPKEKTSSKQEQQEQKAGMGFAHIVDVDLYGSKNAEEDNKDYTAIVRDMKNFCQNKGMMITKGETTSGFEAIGWSMKLVFSVEENHNEDFPALIDRLAWTTAPLNAADPVRKAKSFTYEGYLDKDHPEFGYVYLNIVQFGDYYVFVQGLGEDANDEVIPQAYAMAQYVRNKLGNS